MIFFKCIINYNSRSGVSTIKVTLCLPQTEEEFLVGLTQGFPDDPVDGDDEDEGEDESEESEEEMDEEREKEKSQNGGRRSQSLHSPVEMRADVGSMVSALQQEGETVLKDYVFDEIRETFVYNCLCTKTMLVCVFPL